jgi:hypothetical protein
MTDSKPLTTQQLDDIEARANAATPGPWGVYTFGGDSLIEIAADLEDTGCGYRARRTIARFEEEPLDNDPAHREWTAEEDWAQVQADAVFVARAPEDVPALLAEIRRLRAELAEYEPLNPQQCPAGKHADWLVDSEYAHACPWCQIEALKGSPSAEESHVVADDSSDPEHIDDCPGCPAP